MASDDEVAALRQWLQSLVGQTEQLRLDKYIFDEVQSIISLNSAIQKPSHFYQWMQDMYVSGVAMAIRRQLDNDARTMSLYRFLKRLKGDPSVISRSRYHALYAGSVFATQLAPGDMKTYINDAYDQLVGVGKSQPTADDIELDIEKLQRVAARFVTFANKVIAHDDKTQPSNLPTFGDVTLVVECMEGIVQKYIQLLEAQHRFMGEPNFGYDWKVIFRAAWLPTKDYRPW